MSNLITKTKNIYNATKIFYKIVSVCTVPSVKSVNNNESRIHINTEKY